MEDYAGAHEARSKDVEALLAVQPPRATAAAHLGGIAVECRLKALVVHYHRLTNWNDLSGRAKDPKSKQPIARPGHGLLNALQTMDAIYRRAKADSLLLIHLSRVMNPTGATATDFIDLRYHSTELAATSLNDWRDSMRYVLSWLRKNERVIL